MADGAGGLSTGRGSSGSGAGTGMAVGLGRINPNAMSAVLLAVYLALMATVVWVASTRDGHYLDRHADVIFLAATGTLMFLLTVARAEGTAEERLSSHRIVLGATVLLYGYLIALAVLWERQGLTGVSMMGILVLFTTLVGGNILAGRRSLDVREVRTAITLGTVSMFFGLVGFAPDAAATAEGVLGQTMENFWAVVATVVGFYFGGETLERVLGRKKAAGAGRQEPEEA